MGKERNIPSAMRVTASFSSPFVSWRAKRTSASDQSGNISRITEVLSPYCFRSSPKSPSSSNAPWESAVLWSGLSPLVRRPPRPAKPPLPPRPEPLPREADVREVTSDIRWVVVDYGLGVCVRACCAGGELWRLKLKVWRGNQWKKKGSGLSAVLCGNNRQVEGQSRP